ncbi:MAG: MFS transporter, partial [Salinibacter sp.]|uniref:MFS transporter n=1 Tax=Salinibacter sp. TaxID=2065818 RepID=UPI0035D43ADB
MSTPHTSHDVEVDEREGYWALIVGNLNFRRLWVGNVISLLGDWFNTIALYVLVTELTGSPLALGAVFITKMLPWALSAPLAGVIVDRYDRRRLMVGMDLLRAVVVLGFLLINRPADVPWLYALLTGQVVAGAVFNPAKSAALPNITTPRELLTANALMSATWSTMLAVGAALGGGAVEVLGTDAVFWIDSGTYVVSALFILGTTIPQDTDPADTSLLRSAVREVVDGWRHLRAHPRIGRFAFAKAAWALGGGALVYMLALLGDRIAPTALAAGIGVLFMARGIGTGVGPVVVRALFTDQRRWPIVVGGTISLCGLCYLGVGLLPWAGSLGPVAAICALVVVGHAASGGNWVLSTVTLQKRTEDRYRGRVFSTDWLLVMSAESLSIFAGSALLEAGWLDLAGAVQAFALLQVACGLAWLAIVVPRERADENAPEPQSPA